MQYQSRDQIPEKYRWDLSSMCADDKDFERQLEDAKALPAKLAAYKGRVSTSAADLLAYLQLLDEANVTSTAWATTPTARQTSTPVWLATRSTPTRS